MSKRRLPPPHIRDEFRRDLRARLMREAATTLAPKRRETAWPAWPRRALAVSLVALSLILAGSVAVGSVPGDVTFGLKRAVEEVRVGLTFDEVERVRLLAEITDQRLAELAKVASRNDKAPTASEEFARAVTRFREAVDTLQEAAPEDRSELAQDVADAAREKHEIVLEQLKDQLPEKAKASVERAIEVERTDTPNTKDKKQKSEEQNSTPPDGTASPRAIERSLAPRSASPRPTERRPSS